MPNDELKSSILTECNHSVYNISRLSFPMMDPTIDPSDVQYMSNRRLLDGTKTRLLSKFLDKIKTQRFEDYFLIIEIIRTFYHSFMVNSSNFTIFYNSSADS